MNENCDKHYFKWGVLKTETEFFFICSAYIYWEFSAGWYCLSCMETCIHLCVHGRMNVCVGWLSKTRPNRHKTISLMYHLLILRVNMCLLCKLRSMNSRYDDFVLYVWNLSVLVFLYSIYKTFVRWIICKMNTKFTSISPIIKILWL